MKYSVHIKTDNLENKYHLSVVDLPGCSTESKTVEDGLQQLENVIDSHLTLLSEYGEKIPHAKPIDYHMKSNNLGVWVIIDPAIDPTIGPTTPEKSARSPKPNPVSSITTF